MTPAHTHRCTCDREFTPRLAIIYVTASGSWADAWCPGCDRQVSAEVTHEQADSIDATSRVA